MGEVEEALDIALKRGVQFLGRDLKEWLDRYAGTDVVW